MINPSTIQNRLCNVLLQDPPMRGFMSTNIKTCLLYTSSSPYINPLVVVTKPNGSIRLCLDARKLNSLLVPDYECARSVEELFQKCNGVKYMTKLDLTSGFWQIPIRTCDRKYTAFLYKNKCYQFKVVPFGLSTS